MIALIARLRTWLCSIDWTLPLTVETRGGGPALDRALEEQIRADERHRVISQENTAHGQPPRLHRLSDVLYPNGSR